MIAETSIGAYHDRRRVASGLSQQQRILWFLSNNWRMPNWSIGEIAQALDLEKSTVSGRVRELLNAGLVVHGEKRPDRLSGITVRPIRLAPAQMSLLDD